MYFYLFKFQGAWKGKEPLMEVRNVNLLLKCPFKKNILSASGDFNIKRKIFTIEVTRAHYKQKNSTQRIIFV